MKLAAFADLHAHNFKEFDTKSDFTGSQRLDYIIFTLRHIRNYCKVKNIKYVLFAGDLFHTRAKVNTIVFNSVYDEIKEFHKDGIHLIMIAGNHDQYDNSDVPEHSLHAFNDLPGVYVYGDLAIHAIQQEPGGEIVDVYCVPYSKNVQRTKEWIASQEERGYGRSRICLFHLGIRGGLVGNGSYPMADAFDIEDLRPDFFKYIIGGHFHKRQILGGYPHAFYCGSPIQHSFGDEGEDKGFYVVDTSKRWDIEFVPIPNPKFLTMTLQDVINTDMQAIANEGHYVRLQVTEEELQTALQHLPDNLKYKVELQRKYEENTRVDVKIGMSFEEIVSKYANEYNPEGKEIGLKILDEVMGVK